MVVVAVIVTVVVEPDEYCGSTKSSMPRLGIKHRREVDNI
jgi:hypothetical protein